MSVAQGRELLYPWDFPSDRSVCLHSFWWVVQTMSELMLMRWLRMGLAVPERPTMQLEGWVLSQLMSARPLRRSGGQESKFSHVPDDSINHAYMMKPQQTRWTQAWWALPDQCYISIVQEEGDVSWGHTSFLFKTLWHLTLTLGLFIWLVLVTILYNTRHQYTAFLNSVNCSSKSSNLRG